MMWDKWHRTYTIQNISECDHVMASYDICLIHIDIKSIMNPASWPLGYTKKRVLTELMECIVYMTCNNVSIGTIHASKTEYSYPVMTKREMLLTYMISTKCPDLLRKGITLLRHRNSHIKLSSGSHTLTINYDSYILNVR